MSSFVFWSRLESVSLSQRLDRWQCSPETYPRTGECQALVGLLVNLMPDSAAGWFAYMGHGGIV